MLYAKFKNPWWELTMDSANLLANDTLALPYELLSWKT